MNPAFHTTAILRNYGKKPQPTLQNHLQKEFQKHLPKLVHFCQHMNTHKAFMASSILMGSCLPLSILFAPTFLAIPFDMVISLALPFHMYHGTTLVLQDYVPKQYRPQTIKGWQALSVISAYGLLKISICGPGIGASIKSLWAKPKVVKKQLD